jgi:glycosyltransferase involved in cell wall biosynthesis
VLPFAESLTIVVPAFNERDNLPAVLGALLAWARPNCRALEVLVVDDGSRDGTADVVPRAPDVRLVRHERNQGLSAALRTGFLNARSNFVTWVPADGQIPPEQLGRILDAWNGEDLVLSRYRHRPDGLRRRVMSSGLRLLLRAALGFGDRLDGVYLFRRALLDRFELVAIDSPGTIGFELAAKIRRAGARIASTEIECAPRRSGQSKVASTRNVVATLRDVWRIRRSFH